MFANPVGNSIIDKTEDLFDEIICEGDIDIEKIREILDELIRIRAVQDFSPSEAIDFLYTLKKIIKEEVEEKLNNIGSYKHDLCQK